MLSPQSKRKFLLVLILIGVLALSVRVAVTLLAENVFTRNLTKLELEKEFANISNTAKALEFRFASLEENINLIALNPDIASGSPEKCIKKSKEIVEVLHSKLSTFGRIPLNQVIDCAAAPEAIGTSAKGIVSSDEIFKTQKLTLGRV